MKETTHERPRDELCYDPFSYGIHADPYPVYARLRKEAPVYFNPEHGFWALSRYADVRTALLDHETYCSSRGFTLEDIDDFALPMMIMMDPPDHTRLRTTVNRALTPRRMADLESWLHALAARLLDDLVAQGGGDLIGDFAALLPMAAISRMLGVPEADQDELRRWADAMVHREDGIHGVPESAKRAAGEIYTYFERLLVKRQVNDNDDLVSLLLEAGAQGDITHLEILGFCYLLIIAGNETTTKLIGNVAYQLQRHPDQKAALIDDSSLAPNAVEEVLRFDPVTHMMARTLTRDVELHDRRMQAGQKVALILASANRDEHFWQRPDDFDIHRHDAKDHLAFGFGIHHCIGAALARLEARIALTQMLRRMPAYAIDESGLERVHSGNVRGFARLPVAVR